MKREIREVTTHDKQFAACNSPSCPKGAEFELWQKVTFGPLTGAMQKTDCRCFRCAAEMGWIDADTGETK